MKRFLKTSFVLVSVFLLCINNLQGLVTIQSQEIQTTTQVDIVIDEGQQDLSNLFDSIDRFTQYGLAKVKKQIGVETYEYDEQIYEYPILRYGLINTKGEVVLDVIYSHISDYDDNYYEVGLEQEGMYYAGLVSKKTGEFAIEPVYTWIPNIHEKNHFIMNQYEVVDEQYVYNSVLYTQVDGIVQKAILPAALEGKKIDGFWIEEISENVSYVNSYIIIELEGEGAGSSSDTYRWLVDKNFNPIDTGNITNIYQVFEYDGLLYISTQYSEQQDSGWYSSASVYVGTLNNGKFVYETLIDDVPYTWFNNRDKVIEYVESRDNWRQVKYDLETKEITLTNSYNTSYFIDISRIDDLKFKVDCKTINQVYQCVYLAYTIEDTEFTNNILEGKHVTYVEYMTNDMYRVHLLGNKQNILKRIIVNGKAEYFYMFETDYEGWARLEQNILSIHNWQNNTSFSTVVNVANVTAPISNTSDRIIINNKENTWAYINGQFIFIYSYIVENNEGVSYTTVYKASTNEKILDNVKNASLNIDNDLVFGSYQVADSRKGFIYKDEYKELNANWFQTFNIYGYAKYYSYTVNNNIEGLINRDGKLIVEANYLNVYYDYDGFGNHVVISYESSTGMKYHHIDKNGLITTFGPYNDITFNGKDPAKYMTSDYVYGFIQGTTQHDINDLLVGATDVTSFIDGLVLFSKTNIDNSAMEYYVIDESGNSILLEGVNKFIGRFVKVGESIKYLKGVNAGVVEYIDVSVDLLSTLDRLSFISNSMYLNYKVVDDSGYNELILIIKDELAGTTSLSKLDQIDGKNVSSVSKLTKGEGQNDVPSVDGFYNVYVEGSKVGIINELGELIVKPIYNHINLRKEYFEGRLSVGNHLIQRDGTVISGNNSLPLVYDSIHDVDNKYYTFQKDGVSLTYLKNSEGLTFVGEFTIHKIENITSIYEYYLPDEVNIGNSLVGLLDDKGNVVISHLVGYQYFRYDRRNQLIVPFGNIQKDGVYYRSLGGLYDFSGNEILSKDYNIDFDPTTQEVIVDKNGYVYVTITDENIKYYYYTGTEAKSSSFSLVNRFHLATKTLKFNYLTHNIEKFGDYWKISGLIETNRVFDPSSVVNGNTQAYVQEREGILYYFDIGFALYDQNFQELIGLSNYDGLEELEGNKDLFKTVTYHEHEYGRSYTYGVINKQGVEIVAAEYSQFEYLKEWNMYLLTSYETMKAALYDSNFVPISQNQYSYIYYDYESDLMILQSEYNLEDKDDFEYEVLDTLFGFYNLKTKKLVEPQFFHFDTKKLKKLGQLPVSKPISIQSMTEYCDVYGADGDSEDSGNHSELDCWTQTQYNTKMGIINIDGDYEFEPIYDYITEFNSQGFARYGDYAVFTYYDVENDVYFDHTYQKNTGLYGIETGIVVEPIYSELLASSYSRIYYDAPLFDKDNHIRTVVNKVIDGSYFSGVGMINKQGVVIEPIYQNVKYIDGKYYLQQFNGTWIVRDLNSGVDLNVDLSDLGIYIQSIQLAGDYIIVETVESNEFQSYSDYAVFTLDLEPYIDFGHSSISYDGTYWYLERYNQAFNTYQRAVLDNDLNSVVPFENKYDSLGEYIGGYAIGQSGQKAPTVEEENNSLFRHFFTRAYANQDDDFVLDVLDEEGKVVGDLSDKYESVTLLGMDGDVVKALVVKDGKYYIGTLVSNVVEKPVEEKPVEEEPVEEEENKAILVESISILQTSITLKVGQTAQLNSSISPMNYTESIKEYWSSDDESIAVVDGKGFVKAVGVGETKINYHVNNFIASTNVVTSEDKVVQPPQTPVQKEVFDQLTDAISNTDSLTNAQWFDLLRKVLESNPNFVTELDLEEAEKLEKKYLELFKDNLVYNVENTDGVLSTFTGFILGADLQSLLDNKNVQINVKVSKQVSDDDQDMIDDYLRNNNLDETKVFSFDVTISQVIDGAEVPLVLRRPVTMKGSLSATLIGIGTLNAITIHKGELIVIDVDIENAGFTISSDKFSAFSIFSTKEKVVVVNPELPIEEVVQPQNNYLLWLFGAAMLLVISAFVVYIKGKKPQQA